MADEETAGAGEAAGAEKNGPQIAQETTAESILKINKETRNASARVLPIHRETEEEIVLETAPPAHRENAVARPHGGQITARKDHEATGESTRKHAMHAE